MAFTVLPAPSGKHRRPRRGTVRGGGTLAGVAVLTATSALGATAMTGSAHADSAPVDTSSTVFAQAADVTGSLADSLAAQATAQRKAAEAAKARAEQARKQAEAAARAKAAAKAEALHEAAVRAKAKAAREAAARPTAPPRNAGAGLVRVPVADAPSPPATGPPARLWSSGYHTGVDFLVDTGTSVHAVGRRHGRVGRLGRRRTATTWSSGTPTGSTPCTATCRRSWSSAGQTVVRGRADRPLRRDRQRHRAAPALRGPHGPDYGSDIDPVAYLRAHGVSV